MTTAFIVGGEPPFVGHMVELTHHMVCEDLGILWMTEPPKLKDGNPIWWQEKHLATLPPVMGMEQPEPSSTLVS